IGGFLGATGWVIVLGAVQVITDRPLTLDGLDALMSGPMAAKLAAGLAIALALQLLLPLSKSPFVLPGILLAAGVTLHFVLWPLGLSLADAQAAGWTFAPQETASLSLPWTTEGLGQFPWAAVPSLAGDVLAVMFVTVISLLLNMTGIELATRREADIERELRGLGLANLTTAALGGYINCVSVSRTTL